MKYFLIGLTDFAFGRKLILKIAGYSRNDALNIANTISCGDAYIIDEIERPEHVHNRDLIKIVCEHDLSKLSDLGN